MLHFFVTLRRASRLQAIALQKDTKVFASCSKIRDLVAQLVSGCLHFRLVGRIFVG